MIPAATTDRQSGHPVIAGVAIRDEIERVAVENIIGFFGLPGLSKDIHDNLSLFKLPGSDDPHVAFFDLALPGFDAYHLDVRLVVMKYMHILLN